VLGSAVTRYGTARDRALIVAALHTGLRAEELCGLNPEHAIVNKRSGCLRLSSRGGCSGLIVEIRKALIAALTACLTDGIISNVLKEELLAVHAWCRPLRGAPAGALIRAEGVDRAAPSARCPGSASCCSIPSSLRLDIDGGYPSWASNSDGQPSTPDTRCRA
jgi:hypothetical protein